MSDNELSDTAIREVVQPKAPSGDALKQADYGARALEQDREEARKEGP